MPMLKTMTSEWSGFQRGLKFSKSQNGNTTMLAVSERPHVRSLAEKRGSLVFFNQGPSLSRIFRVGFEVGIEARCPYAECTECPALPKSKHHPRGFFVGKSIRSRGHLSAPLCA
jgi:hypothetical protein